MVKLWDNEFKAISKIDLTQSQDGYQGEINFLFIINLYRMA